MTSFQRLVPVISLRGTSAIPPTHLRGLTPCSNSYCARSSRFTDFNARRDEITRQLVEAAETAGFLTLVDHGISVQEIEAQFAISKTFFDLSPERKGKTPHSTQDNDGWEYKAQLRPSTGTYDQKESLWLQRNSQWPSEEDVPGFRETTEAFMDKCAEISNQVFTCLAVALGFPENFFVEANDPTEPDCLTQLRLLHYPPAENAAGTWRAGSHTDIGCLTLLFQRDGEDGLEICPGRESHTSFAMGDVFTPVPAETGPIVVNIGDMLMAWSDDRLKSNFHRVRAKDVGLSPSRYSIAYFNQSRRDFVVQGPQKKYPPTTVGQYFANAVARNFTRQQEGIVAESEDQYTNSVVLIPLFYLARAFPVLIWKTWAMV